MRNIIWIVFTAAALLPFVSCEKCADVEREGAPYTSYLDVPGVTAEEIEAIEALRARKKLMFTYGMVFSSETFHGQYGAVRGFSALFCEYLTSLFGIKFVTETYEWGDLMAGLEDGSIDFTGELTPNEERRKTYYMTDPIAVRFVAAFRMREADLLEQIVRERRLRYAFLDGTTTVSDVASLSREPFDTILVHDYGSAYEALKSGLADAFFEEHIVSAVFDAYGDVVSRVFLPLSYSPVALTARKPELAPVISVVQKILQSGGRKYLTKMYRQGEREFIRQRLERTLTNEERRFIRKSPVVSVAAEYDNYPISLYNKYENEWQGVFIDALREVEALTGITFKIVNPPNADWPVVLKMLEDGEASIISELIRSKSREGRFLWPETPLSRDHHALLSKSETPNMSINEVLDMRVGMFEGTAHAELFKQWFPDYVKTNEYNVLSAFEALDRGEIDLLMASQKHLFLMTNYMERPGYKINILFDRTYESYVGFNINDTLLCSVVDKAFKQIDLKAITDNWTRKTFDYRVKVAQSRLPWFIGVCVLLSLLIVLLFVLYKKVRGEELRMEKLVEERTVELNEKSRMLERISMTDQLTGLPNRRCFDQRMELVWRTAIRDRTPVSLLMMDLDKFKLYNDTYGHQQGDTLLRAAARVIENTAKRPGDLAARWGGEEFCALLSNTDKEGAVAVAEAIRAGMERMTVTTSDGTVTKTTISIGVCTITPRAQSSQDSFISSADDALYRAKETRNKVVAFQAQAG